MGIKDFLDRLRQKKAKYKEFEEDMKVQETYVERKKSANERELERFHNEAREKQIKEELEHWRKKAKHEAHYGHQILKTKNMFVNEKPTILRNKSIFGGKSNLNLPGGLFFK